MLLDADPSFTVPESVAIHQYYPISTRRLRERESDGEWRCSVRLVLYVNADSALACIIPQLSGSFSPRRKER